MPPAPVPLRTGWDPERHARRLVPAGGLLAAGGLYAGGWVGVVAAVVGLLLLLAAAYSARDGLLLLGPFARYELARTARTGKRRGWRVVYVLVFTLMLFLNFLAFAPDMVWKGQLTAGRFKNHVQTANAAFFAWYGVCLIGYVGALAVTQFTSLVAEERAGKRWEILLTTDLRPREILFGKAAGRVPQLLDPILASIPVLTIATLFGGVSPTIVILVVVAALALAFGIAGVAAFYSVFCPTVATAATNTIGMGVMYFMFSGIATGGAFVPQMPPAVAAGFSAFAAGNPLAVVALEKRAGPIGEPLETTLVRATRKFAAFHLGVGLLFGFVAGRRLRTAEPWGTKGKVRLRRPEIDRPVTPDRADDPKFRKRHVGAVADRPPVSDYPLAWWEWFGTMTSGQVVVVRKLTDWRHVFNVAGTLLILFFLARVGLWIYSFVASPRLTADAVDRVISSLMLISVWFLTWPMFLGPLLRATRTVVRERVGDTLDTLRTTPLDPRDVIFQKWLGCVQSAIPFGVLGLGVLVAAVLTGFASILSLIGLVVAVPVYVMALAAYGLVFSVRAKTAARATFAMVLITFGLGYLITFLISVAVQAGPVDPFKKNSETFVVAQFPPSAVGAMLAGPMSELKSVVVEPFLGGLQLSLGLFMLLGVFSYQLAVRQFTADDARARGRPSAGGK